MANSELATYELQLAQVKQAVEIEPDNTELKNLQAELESLIELARQLEGETAGPSSTGASSASKAASPPHVAAPSGHGAQSGAAKGRPAAGGELETKPEGPGPQVKYVAGEEVTARWSEDGKWYPARVVSVTGSTHKPFYTVIFKRYNNTEVLDSSSLRKTKSQAIETSEAVAASTSSASATQASSGSSTPGGAPTPTAAGAVPGSKRVAHTLTAEEEAERERKRKRNDKKAERRETKAQVVQDKAASWQKFAKKGAKKGYGIAGLEGKSMFSTPDDPYAKVGVVGAGRGMTKVDQRKRHIYDGA